MELIKQYNRRVNAPTRRYTRELRSDLNSENVFAEWYACNNWPTKSELRFTSAASKPGKSAIDQEWMPVEAPPFLNKSGKH